LLHTFSAGVGVSEALVVEVPGVPLAAGDKLTLQASSGNIMIQSSRHNLM
jgi:hypothetical protein